MASKLNTMTLPELKQLRRDTNDRIAYSSGMHRNDSIRFLHRIEKEISKRQKGGLR